MATVWQRLSDSPPPSNGRCCMVPEPHVAADGKSPMSGTPGSQKRKASPFALNARRSLPHRERRLQEHRAMVMESRSFGCLDDLSRPSWQWFDTSHRFVRSLMIALSPR
jgi:hypothetical protein